MRFRPKFTLRSLMIATAISGVFFGWLTNTLVRVNHQRQIVAQLQARGARVMFDLSVDPTEAELTGPPPGWKVFRSIFGEDAFSSVTYVYEGARKIENGDIELLKQLPALCTLGFEGSETDDSTISQLHKLPGLRRLQFWDTSATADGIAGLSQCRKLMSLSLSGQRIDDSVLAGVAKLPNLERLYLGTPSVTSVGMQHLEGLSRLTTLSLWDIGDIDDQGIASIGKLTDLNSLQLTNMPVTDAGFGSIGKLTHLSSLQFENVPVSDRGFAELGQLNNLRTLWLWNRPTNSGTGVSDIGIQTIRSLKQLTTLYIRGMQFGDAGMDAIGELTQLRELDLQGPQFTDASAQFIAQLAELRELELSTTSISDVGLKKLAPLVHLNTLTVGLNVTEEAARELRQSLPNCTIVSSGKEGTKFILK